MLSPILVVDDDDVPLLPGAVAASAFLGDQAPLPPGSLVVGLCADASYLSTGWYVSLMAEARGGRPLPPTSLAEQRQDGRAWSRALREAHLDVLDSDEVRARVQRLDPAQRATLGSVPPLLDHPDKGAVHPAEAHELLSFRVLAGSPVPEQGPKGAPSFRRLARQVFGARPHPMLELHLARDAGRWAVYAVHQLRLDQLDDTERRVLVEAAGELRAPPASEGPHLRSLAVLWDPDDAASASTSETIDRLARVGWRMGLRVERIGPRELDRVGEHDALFIRTLTGVDQPSWAFAVRARSLGLPVIDDPDTIVRCSNKVYLQALLAREGLPVPRTEVVDRSSTWRQVSGSLGQPVVLKVPDGSFSKAVFRLDGEEAWNTRVPRLLERSPLLIAQEYLPTPYDWRVGLLDGKVQWVARYHMVPGHWQIQATRGDSVRFGRVEAVAVRQAPKEVVELARRAGALVGEGLLGVDLKETARGPVVIEVNDNPNLDLGYEDAVGGEAIYEALVGAFLSRLDEAGVRPPKAPRRSRSPRLTDPAIAALRRPIGRLPAPPSRSWRAYEVVGLELEYPVVDRDLNVLPVVEDVLATLNGRPTSDVSLGRLGLSNEIVDHVLELKNEVPHRSLQRVEEELVEGVRRVALVLDRRHRARLLPGGMHPWFHPEAARIWPRSGRRVYETYARLFDVQTHGWANVQAVHVNLPLGTDEEAVAMVNAARLLVPYLPALAASSPLVEGELTGSVDNRVVWLLEHQSRLPESMARLVPEPLARLSDYRRDVLGPMYAALDRLPDADALRGEFLNARGAVIKASRRSLEVRILDVQECVHLDVTIAFFVRRALQDTARRLSSLRPVDQGVLEDDLLAVARGGSAARVAAPHLPLDALRAGDGTVSARQVLEWHLDHLAPRVGKGEQVYLEQAARLVAQGSLAEAILRRLRPLANEDEAFTEAARAVWIELCDCLVDNRPWPGRGA